MGREINKEIVIDHKKKAISKLNKTFETFINSPNYKHQKKADLVAYWLENYSDYLMKEERYDYSSVMKFKRGDVISLNFGFNVGSEQGGLHYAIVLDNDNKHSSPVITVIPLSSGTEKNVYERDVFLGNELYEKLIKKHEELLTKARAELEEFKQSVDKISQAYNSLPKEFSEETKEMIAQLKIQQKEMKLKQEIVEKEIKSLMNYSREIEKLKEGSIALMEQITTISKMRIYNPKNSMDLLYGIKFSDPVMDKVNEKLKELFLFSK